MRPECKTTTDTRPRGFRAAGKPPGWAPSKGGAGQPWIGSTLGPWARGVVLEGEMGGREAREEARQEFQKR